jgi:chemotaxis response regulator CheB
MKVFEVKDGETVKPNCVFIIPPTTSVRFTAEIDGDLRASQQIPIWQF